MRLFRIYVLWLLFATVLSLKTIGVNLIGAITYSANSIDKYEYWFDNNYSQKVTQSIVSGTSFSLNLSISTSALNPGVHSFNIRYKDSYGNWSIVSSDLFYKPLQTSNQQGNQMNAYEYWFDSDYSNKTFQTVSSSSITLLNTSVSTSTMNPGVHSFNIRYKDSYGNWSIVSSDLFYKPLQTSNQLGNQMNAYEYWFDNDYSQRVSQVVSSTSIIILNTSVTTGTMNPGVHSFNVRYKDSYGRWSSVSSDLFYKPLPATNQLGNTITLYEYWFDNDYGQKIQNSVLNQNALFINSNISTSILSSGAHSFNIRFKDTFGNWSIVNSSLFYKPYEQLCANNKISAYRYWIDTLFSQHQYTVLSTPIQYQLLSASMSMTNTTKGKHVFNIQFMDSTQKWSLVQADTFVKASHPIALFNSDYYVFCDSGTVHFTNNSIDGDTYLWDFGDGNQSNIFSPSHHYSSVGQYITSLTIKDTVTSQTSTYSLGIIVSGKPIYSLGSDTLVCPNVGFELSASSSNASSYIWSNGLVTSTIVPTVSGTYWCSATNQYGCTFTDSINVSYKTLASASYNSVINALVVSFNNTSTNAVSYLWDFGDGSTSTLANPTHTFTLPGSYSVTLIAFNDCGSDTIIDVVNLVGVGVENVEINKSIFVFPNPNSGTFNIVMKNSLGENTFINLFSSDGKLVYNDEIAVDSNLFTKKLEIDNLSNGFYYLHINNSIGKAVKKIIILR